MLALIPLFAFLSLYLVLLRFHPADGRLAFLRAAIAWAVTMALATELLSLFHLVTVPGLTVAWLLPCVATGAWLAFRRGSSPGRPVESLRQWLRRLWPEAWADRLLLIGLLAVVGIT